MLRTEAHREILPTFLNGFLKGGGGAQRKLNVWELAAWAHNMLASCALGDSRKLQTQFSIHSSRVRTIGCGRFALIAGGYMGP
jgi:hypothetical protein